MSAHEEHGTHCPTCHAAEVVEGKRAFGTSVMSALRRAKGETEADIRASGRNMNDMLRGVQPPT